MCGIAGAIHIAAPASEAILLALAHRGPDAQGTYYDRSAELSLFHTRLSIVDLSPAGNQPFESNSGNTVLVFNGEIYNHRILAKRYGLRMRSSCDTEVLVELYERLGLRFVEELNGMFAGAIWDKRLQKLILFRDRLGIKPLYYHRDGLALFFASELGALQILINKPLDINLDAAATYLHRGYIAEPNTIYKNVLKFPAGTLATLEEGELRFTSYWRAEDQIQAQTYSNERKVLDELEGLLTDSIALRLIADVPSGSLLSGGADSGLVTAIASKLHQEKLATFNVAFSDHSFVESHYASAMAEVMSTEHHSLSLGAEDVNASWQQLSAHVGEPFADHSLIPTAAVCQYASRHVKMVLSGDGGDELFMGYGRYSLAALTRSQQLQRWWKLGLPLLRSIAPLKGQKLAKLLRFRESSSWHAQLFALEQGFFSSEEIEQLLGLSYRDPFDESVFARLKRNLNSREQAAFFDLTNYLKDDLLIKVDRASMYHGLEVRVPFLDHRLVSFALNVAPELKIKGGESKYLVKKLLEKFYPKSLIYRKKWGFSMSPSQISHLAAQQWSMHKQVQLSEECRSVITATDNKRFVYANYLKYLDKSRLA